MKSDSRGSQTPPGARGDWYPLSGQHQGEYKGLLVGASGALTPAETSAICPFDLNKGVAPEQVDLENVVFEQFRVQRKYARPLARAGFENLVHHECCRYVPGKCRNLKVNSQLEGLTSEAVLLPVWIMAYRYQDQVFRFLLNGQTGKATGEAPTSWNKLLTIIGIVIVTILVGAALAALLGGIATVVGQTPRYSRASEHVAAMLEHQCPHDASETSHSGFSTLFFSAPAFSSVKRTKQMLNQRAGHSTEAFRGIQSPWT